MGSVDIAHLDDLSAHLDDIGFGEGFGGSAARARWQIGVVEESLRCGGGRHKMDDVVEGEWGIVLTHVCE